jgi:hypothetical protein
MRIFSQKHSGVAAGIGLSDLDAPEQNAANVIALAHLWAGQFQQIMNLALAGAGGLLILAQTDLVTISGRWWVALITFVAAAGVSMIGQGQIVDAATEGHLPVKAARRMVAIASVLFGGSLYLLVRICLEAAR